MASALVRDRRVRGSAEIARGVQYPRLYFGPADPDALAALLPAIGDEMPSSADCPAGTKVVSVTPEKELRGGRMAVRIVGELTTESGGL